jgi:ABC-type nickel/cobalt efflux system permease component RcnA
MSVEAFSDGLLGWIIRIAGLFWLVGAFMLFRQIRMEMMLDRMTSRLETMAREFEAEGIEDDDGYGNLDAPVKSAPRTQAEQAIDRWTDRDDAARRGWIAAQAVVLGVTALAMIVLHPIAAWLVALLVIGQGAYFIWREYTARHAPNAESANHARPTTSTVNAGWFSLVVACLVWAAVFRGVLY